jgi:hypothetical protein
MVEAALALPLAIGAVMAVIYLMINLYSLTALQSALHVELRGAAGESSGLTGRELAEGGPKDKYRAGAEATGFEVKREALMVHPYVFAAKKKIYGGNALVLKKASRESGGRCYIVDEVGFFRRADFAKRLVGLKGAGGEGG